MREICLRDYKHKEKLKVRNKRSGKNGKPNQPNKRSMNRASCQHCTKFGCNGSLAGRKRYGKFNGYKYFQVPYSYGVCLSLSDSIQS